MGVIYWGNMVDIYGGGMWGSNGGHMGVICGSYGSHMGKFHQGHMEVISWSYGS